MKVILQQDVKGQGKKGQMIEASDGYARNFLLPRKLAVPATAENVNTMKMQEKAKKAQEAAEKAEAEATAAKLKELTVKVVAKGGNGGRLFGAVTSKEIADALQAQHGIAIPKTKIVQDEPIKAFGGYELKVKLGYEVTGTLKVVVAEAEPGTGGQRPSVYAQAGLPWVGRPLWPPAGAHRGRPCGVCVLSRPHFTLPEVRNMPSEEELLTRQMPHSTEAEQSVLGSMLIDARCVPEVIEALRPEDFYLRTNREIYETIYSMFNFSLTIDPVTVLEHMKQNGVYDENTSRNYILQLMEITPTAANVKEYVAIVKDKALLRRIAETAGELTAMVQEGTGTAQEVLEAAEQRIYAIRQGRSAQGLAHISSVILNVYERLNELAASDSAVPGLSTGLPDVDMAISGLNKSDLILLAARPGMGKTSFALNMLLHAGKFSGKTVVFFSLEMSREQLAMRLISGESFVDNKKLVTGKLGEEDWTKIAAASAALNQTQILIDDNPSLSVADMNAKCRRVDNLGLVVRLPPAHDLRGRPPAAATTASRSSPTSAPKIIAKELNVPVVCLSQLSAARRAAPTSGPCSPTCVSRAPSSRTPTSSLFLYRDDYYNDSDENHNLAECIIAKNRHGETRTVELQWLPEYTTFSSIDRRHIEY
ncbi:MAG: 50S ribosomal protein L9 [Flavonifractor plautii]